MCRTSTGHQPRTILQLTAGFMRITCAIISSEWIANASWNDLAVTKVGIRHSFLCFSWVTLDPPHSLRINTVSDGEEYEVLRDGEVVATCATYGKAKKLVRLLSNSH